MPINKSSSSKGAGISPNSGIISEKIAPNKTFDEIKSKEQDKRDTIVSEIMSNFSKNYRDKVAFTTIYKPIIFWSLISILSICLGGLIWLIYYFSIQKDYDMTSLGTIITALASFLVALLGSLKIIMTYIFPNQEEQYITDLVSKVQKNDLDTQTNYMKYLKDDSAPKGKNFSGK